MAEWTAPFSLPKFTDEQFKTARAAYIAKNGYTITVPGLSDIFKIGVPAPMTLTEQVWWKKKQFTKFSASRLKALQEEKAKKRARFMGMLGSPSPDIVRNVGSIMTSVDDAQDAISTLGVLGKIGMRVAPKVLGKILGGPVGVLTTIADALNMVQAVGMFCMAPMLGKRMSERHAGSSPKHNKIRVKRAQNIKNWKPNKGDWIQGLQTTEQVFGFGISLGPLMGLAQDVVAGTVRTLMGESVNVKLPVPNWQEWLNPAQKLAKALPCLFGWLWETDDDDSVLWIVAALLTFQHLFAVADMWNPLKMMDFSQQLQVKALEPTNALTIEVIQEGPVPYPNTIGWPQTSTLWAPIDVIQERTENTARDNLMGFMDRNKHMWRGFVGGTAAVNAAQYAVGTMEGEYNTMVDYSVQMRAAIILLENGLRLDPNQPIEKFRLFNEYLLMQEELNWMPTLKNLTDFCDTPWNDIKLVFETVTFNP